MPRRETAPRRGPQERLKHGPDYLRAPRRILPPIPAPQSVLDIEEGGISDAIRGRTRNYHVAKQLRPASIAR